MMAYLTETIKELSFDYVPGHKSRGVNPEREAWSLGCVRGFLDKMKAEKAAVMKQATSTAIVFIGNKTEEAKTALWTKMGWTKMGKGTYRPKGSRTEDTQEAMNRGYRKGQTLTVNAGLPGSSEPEPNKLYE